MTTDVLDGFRDGETARRLIGKIRELSKKDAPATFMEVCGTHTVAFFRSGLREALSGAVRLISGPGCPVCVTPNRVLDAACAYAGMPDTIVVTFGDMMRVPGSRSSLERVKAEGGDVRIAYSPDEIISMAKSCDDKRVIFIGIGFETTAPTVAASILKAKKEGIENCAVLCAHRLIPPALDALAASTDDTGIEGFLCPGHVSAIIGGGAYVGIAEKHRIPCVVTGFEQLDMLQGIMMLIEQVQSGRAEVGIQYSRAVTKKGNQRAVALMSEVFERADAEWRGLGIIPESGLRIREEFAEFDAEKRWPVEPPPPKENPGCRCADVLMGRISPPECPLFGAACSPENPAGACMVSSEGSCAAHYRYGRRAK